MNLWLTEWRIMTRQRSYFSFLFLWIIVFSLLFLLESNNNGLSGFTNITGTIVNIIIYLIPLFMMLSGSFSIANEIENGQWALLCTYPLENKTYILGKLAGLYTSQTVVFTLSFGLSIMLGIISGNQLAIKWLLGIYFFSLLLIYAFLILGLFFGTLVNSRWKALTVSVTAWFFLIMIWPTALIAMLGFVPYPMIGVIMKISLVLNPAEFLRVFLISKWDSGSVFGQPYDAVVHLFNSEAGWLVLICYLFAYLFLFAALSNYFLWRRRQK